MGTIEETCPSGCIHVLDEEETDSNNFVWTMLCGEQVVVFENPSGALSLTPKDFMFYIPSENDEPCPSATCIVCRAVYIAREGE